MRLPGAICSILAGLAIALAPAVLAVDPGDVPAVVADPTNLLPAGQPADPPAQNPIPPGKEAAPSPEPGFADEVSGSFQDTLIVASLATVAVAGVGLVSLALVTRYISPKEALKNPQRAMLYGFVRGNPGVHLKRLSEEFHMKTSSILWHIRKLESAELVRSERANGFRVFYPTAGGVDVRNLSRAVTALQNSNAHALFAALQPGVATTSTQLADKLGIHSGTARWHLKKMKDFGLVDEVPGPEGARYLPTPLGQKAAAAALSATPSTSLSSAGPNPDAAANAAQVTA